jgi:hypothetical protein
MEPEGSSLPLTVLGQFIPSTTEVQFIHSFLSLLSAFKFILTVSSHLCFCLTPYLWQSGFPVAVLYTNTPYPRSKGYRESL